MKLICSAAKWLRDKDGLWISFQVKNQDDDNILSGLDEFTGKEIELSVKPYRQKRSLEANAYAWVLISKIAEKTGIKTIDIYRSAIKNIGGNSEIVCARSKTVEELKRIWESHGMGWICEEFPSKIPGCTNVQLFYGSSAYDTKQMSRLIDLLVEDASSLGIPVMTDLEIERMINQWGDASSAGKT